MKAEPRAIVIVLDSVGVGAMPDAADFGDPPHCNTLGNVAAFCGGLELPNLAKLGMGRISNVKGLQDVDLPQSAFGKMAEKAPGKDTTTGHWEMTGAILTEALSLFPEGFPNSIVEEFIAQTGRGVLANISISGTVVIDEFAAEQALSGHWIVYTSADSVFQVAAHEDVIPLKELYEACVKARNILEPYNVGRVIARPFAGPPGAYKRTPNRKDYALDPPETTVLEKLHDRGIPVTGVGKIGNIFNQNGITRDYPTMNNSHGMDVTIKLLDENKGGLLFVNLVDFDSKFGHRNDPGGYGQALEEFDQELPEVLSRLRPQDLLIITADHGCDPTTQGTNHSREYVPLLVRGHRVIPGTDLGTRTTFADVGQSLLDFWGFPPHCHGTSFLQPRENIV